LPDPMSDEEIKVLVEQAREEVCQQRQARKTDS
jgi:hypothetical protein